MGIDETPTQNSNNAVSSGGTYNLIKDFLVVQNYTQVLESVGSQYQQIKWENQTKAGYFPLAYNLFNGWSANIHTGVDTFDAHKDYFSLVSYTRTLGSETYNNITYYLNVLWMKVI